MAEAGREWAERTERGRKKQRGQRGGREGKEGRERAEGTERDREGRSRQRGSEGVRGQRGTERDRGAERGKRGRGTDGEALACRTGKAGLTSEGGWEVEVDETRQTEVSPIHFQEGAPLTGAFGEKDKNTNHHPKCTCYFPSGVRNWIVSGVSGKMQQMGWAWSSSPHRQWGKEEVAWHGEAGLSEDWWASHGVPIHCGLGKLPRPLMPDACSSCAGCPVDLDPIWEAELQVYGMNLCLVCSDSGERFTGIKQHWYAFLAVPCHSPWVIGVVCQSLRGSDGTMKTDLCLQGYFLPQTP